MRARARFAAFTYLAALGLVFAVLGGLVVSGSVQPPRPGVPVAAPSEPSEPAALQDLQPQESAPPELPAAPPSVPTAVPTEAAATPAPRRAARPAAKPTPKPAPAEPAPGPALAADQVGITDSGIFPKALSVVAGSTVTWTNMGSAVHTATSAAGAGPRLDTGGLAAGQSYSVTLFDPGTYQYTSAPDCLASGGKAGFDCSGARVTVLPPASAAAAPAPDADVQVTDAGFVPARVSIKLNGSVTWTNQGAAVHTATSASPLFDTGGLAPRQSATLRFPSAGTYTYTSAPDCLNGNRSASFNCAATFTVFVSP